MISNKVRDLAEGQGVYAFLLNPQGRILGDLYAYNLGESLLMTTGQEQSEKITGVLRRYIIMDKVELSDVSEQWVTIALAGPGSGKVLKKAGMEAGPLQPLQFSAITCEGVEAVLTRSDNPAAESYEVRVALEKAAVVAEALSQAGARGVSAEAWELLRIGCGIPRYGVDIRERDLPQETEQTRALNFNKGCYIGQEIVERIRSRGNVHRTFTGFEIESGGLPGPGTKVVVDGKEVGEITSAAVLPVEESERKVALGYIRREISQPGTKVMAGESSAVVKQLPLLNS